MIKTFKPCAVLVAEYEIHLKARKESLPDYTNPPEYKLSWEECDKITAHTLKYYKHLVAEQESPHVDDIKYNKKLKKSVDFILKYLGESLEQ